MAPCSIPDCGGQVVARGWCSRHWQRWRRYGDPLGSAPPRVTDHADGTRTCSVCSARLPLSDFDLDRTATGGRRSHCKACRSKRMKKWYADNQARQLERHHARVADHRDRIRAQDAARYERHREKRLDLAKNAVHVRRLREKTNPRVRGITVRSLRDRHGDLCCYCSVPMSFESLRHGQYDPIRATIEHVVPLSAGGAHDWENTRLACWQCNLRKHAKPLDEWRPDS